MDNGCSNAPPAASDIFLKRFGDYFSEKAIINELCRFRVKLAQKRNDSLFLHRISADELRVRDETDLDIFPPRREWKRFRPAKRENRGSQKLNLIALTRAITVLRFEKPKPKWAKQLEIRIRRIRRRALAHQKFFFGEPAILAGDKDPSKHEYRPIAVFGLEDKILDSLTARYLREQLDCALGDSCLAFRCGKNGKPPPQIHDAVRKILNVNRYHRTNGLFVAECDIKGFFDCVAHEIAWKSLDDLEKDAKKIHPRLKIDPRAKLIFKAFLKRYSFPTTVLGKAIKSLRKSDPEGVFKWPEEDLKTLYSGEIPMNIGVPQGGALSCVIANAVLHSADKAMKGKRSKLGSSFTYLRYCDDMIVLAPKLSTCKAAYQSYCDALNELKLPCHNADVVKSYGKDFWSRKSKAPYHWGRPVRKSTVPWIQFVGYQVRHDGMLRVRQKSLKKHVKKLTDETNKLLAVLNPGRSRKGEIGDFAEGLRKRKSQIVHRFRQKLISLSAGRRRLGRLIQQPMPLCWSAGFRELNGEAFPKNILKNLDRHRERQVRRIMRRLKDLPQPEKKKRKPGVKALKHYGFAFSYSGQLRNKL